MQRQLKHANFIHPTPVQAAALPPALEGRDVLATAQTGTGKTLSFLIPVIERLAADPKDAKALVLLPMRELAMQVLAAWRDLAEGRGKAALVCGGLTEDPQLAAIRRGARLIVATPGRLEDYLSRRLVNLSDVKILVLDEVDRMLDMGFKPAIGRIAAVLPPERQTLCFSATLSPAIREVASLYLKSPVRIEIGSELKPSPNVKLQTFEVPADKKAGTAGASAGNAQRQLHGVRSDKAWSGSGRSAVIACRICGGPHLARGIDVADVAHVVNFDLPREAEDFVHRVGRTGRAASHGVASTFAAPDEAHAVKKIERTLAISTKNYRVRSKPTAYRQAARSFATS